MTTKKRLKNIPVLHDEVKTKRTVVLTPTAWKNIKAEAANQKTSASELISCSAFNMHIKRGQDARTTMI
ncbi:hypothetical protein [Nostoc commune]|uniref:hypothetical protein n=1 Tax=Nostoc commune TaxID=1178 RepID=UPI0018C67F15|nr:hypothetical protein [Nostoc commune]MBG1262666.1 hypothetical protein [Nostoc commune BAE]